MGLHVSFARCFCYYAQWHVYPYDGLIMMCLACNIHRHRFSSIIYIRFFFVYFPPRYMFAVHMFTSVQYIRCVSCVLLSLSRVWYSLARALNICAGRVHGVSRENDFRLSILRNFGVWTNREKAGHAGFCWLCHCQLALLNTPNRLTLSLVRLTEALTKRKEKRQ